jgi:hypothetical protein
MPGLEPRYYFIKQLFTLLLGSLLGLAIFISPYQLHNHPGSIFSKLNTSSHHHHHTPHSEQLIKCLRCVLYGFQIAEDPSPIIFILLVLGLLSLSKPQRPFRFVPIKKSARAPPLH